MRVNACPRQGYGGSLIKRILEDSFTETVCTACARAVGAEGQLKARAVPVDELGEGCRWRILGNGFGGIAVM